MYKICKNEQSAQRQKYIAECMVQLWKREPYRQISVTDICRQASIPRKTFYRYFESKEDVFLFLCEYLLMQYENYSASDCNKQCSALQKDFENFFAFNKQQTDLWEILQRDNMAHQVIEWVVSQIIEHDRLGRMFQHSQDRLVQYMKISFFTHGLFALFFDWKKRAYINSSKEMAQLAMQLMNKPLCEW